MKKTIYFLLLIMPFYNGCRKMEKVDLIIYNARIYSVNQSMEVFQCLAVRNGKFVAAGTKEDVLGKYHSSHTIDLKGKYVYPGFIDPHCHFYSYGLHLQKADLRGTRSIEEIINILVKFRKLHPGASWIIGRGWDQNLWKIKEFPDNTLLDKFFNDIPVLLVRVDGHAALANSAALKLAGLHSGMTLRGGRIETANGRLTGILIDNAVDLVSNLVPKPTVTDQINALKEAEKNCFSVGLTNVSDAGLDYEIVHLIDSLQQSKKLSMRIYAMLNPTEDNIKNFILKGIYKTDKLTVRSIKLYADGALGSRGACLLKPYTDKPEQQGFILYPDSYYRRFCDLAFKNNYQVNVHAIGDSANRYVLQLFGMYLKGKNDRRWRIEHAQVLNEKDFHFFSDFSVIPSVQPTHATSDMKWAIERLGKERLKFAYAYKMLLEENGRIADGSDFPVEDINPLYGFYAAVFRQDQDGYPPDGFQMENALTREQALKGMTIWAAFANFEENETGSIESGKNADFVVLDQDIMTCPAKTILKTKVLRTYLNGEEVFIVKKRNEY